MSQKEVIILSGVVVAIIVALYTAILAYYIVLEKKEKFKFATIIKVVLSAYAAAVCIYAAICLNELIFYIFAIGLVFAVPADFFLQYIITDIKKYRAGILCFGLMHICLLVSFYLTYTIAIYEFIIFAILIGILLAFQILGKWKMGEEKNQLTIYTVFVVFMAAKAISIYITEPAGQLFTLILAFGGLFFFISDLFLGIWAYSGNRRFLYLALNRTIYFAGQLCLAFYLVFRLPT